VDPEDVFCSGCGVKIKTKTRNDENGPKAGQRESCISVLTESGFTELVNCAHRQDKLARDFLPKNTKVLILACFFGCLFIVSSTYVLFSGQPFYGNSSDQQDGIQKDRNTQICGQIATEYYESHTYTDDDVYDCDNMAQDVWNMLKAKGINARIAVGDFKPGSVSGIGDEKPVNETSDSGNSGLINVYDCICKDTGLLNSSMIDNLTHAWVLAEVSPGNWLAIECTGGYVVKSETDRKYYSGLTFTNPKNYRSFLELYSNWKKQIKDYEDERLCYNKLQDTYNNANYSDQEAMKKSVEIEEDRLREKEETFLKTDSELQALLRYG